MGMPGMMPPMGMPPMMGMMPPMMGMMPPAAPAAKNKKLSKTDKLLLQQKIAQEKMWMMQMSDMMNLQKMSFVQAMQVPLANMQQAGLDQKMELANAAEELNDQKMEILEMAKELALMKQEMMEAKAKAKGSSALERLDAGSKSPSTGSKAPKSKM